MKPVSWVRVLNGINKYVTETSEEISIESVQLDMSTGRLVAKAKQRPKLVVNLSSTNVPIHEREWIYIDPKPFNEGCLAVSKFMIRLLRPDETIPREKDEGVRFEDLVEKFKVYFVGTTGWTVDASVSFLAKGGGP